jgi:hypothetical protein
VAEEVAIIYKDLNLKIARNVFASQNTLKWPFQNPAASELNKTTESQAPLLQLPAFPTLSISHELLE